MINRLGKNIVATTVAVILALGLALPAMTASANTSIPLNINNTANDIWVFVDGERVIFEDQQPIIVNDRTLVPVRGVFEALGYDVTWIPETRTARLERRAQHYSELHSIDIPMDDTSFMTLTVLGGPRRITPEVPQRIINGRAMLPLSAIIETMEGVEARWDGPNRSVIITTTGGGHTPVATPVPTATPEPPVVTPTPAPVTTPSPAPAADAWMTPFLYTQSSIVSPNRRLNDAERQAWINEYNAMGGASAFELEVVRLVNEARADHGLPAFEISNTLMMAARFYSQTIGNLGLSMGHQEGPYGGSRGTVHAFGMARGMANGNAGAKTPESVVGAWRNSPAHWDAILRDTDLTLIGFGSHLEGQRVINYLVTGE